MPEFTWPAVLAGVVLGILFGASSLYLVLKVGMTVSASIPVAVLSITLFRGLAKAFNIRPATILENNIVQTTGSAGESIAFGVGVTIPALLLLGFDMSLVRVMTVASLGGLLGILMMIPLRRAFIVQQHGLLRYPEGTACADVLIVGELGGATARTVFAGFGLAFVHKFLMQAMRLWALDVNLPLFTKPFFRVKDDALLPTAGSHGLRGGVLGGELAPELLGVGYIIGPRIASIMMSGAVLAYLVMVPLIVMFGDGLTRVLAPAAPGQLIRDMDVSELRDKYILYIGAGAVATGGIISMFQALPLIIRSLHGAFGDLASGAAKSKGAGRTQRDLPLTFVIFGSVALVIALAASPALGLGFSFGGLLARVHRDVRLPVRHGLFAADRRNRLLVEPDFRHDRGHAAADVPRVLVFGTHRQDGHAHRADRGRRGLHRRLERRHDLARPEDRLLGRRHAAPAANRHPHRRAHLGRRDRIHPAAAQPGRHRLQQEPRVSAHARVDVTDLPREHVGGEYAEKDGTLYYALHVGEGEHASIPAGKYLVNEQGRIVYFVDPAINGKLRFRDDGAPVSNKFDAPKTRLMALIIDGILNRKLPWELVLIGALIAVVLELAGVPSLPFAVGVYLPIQTSMPIFLGGLVRWAVDKIKGQPDDDESSPGVLLGSGYIAGGSIAGVLIAFFSFAPKAWTDALKFGVGWGTASAEGWNLGEWPDWPILAPASILSMATFGFLMICLALTGLGVMFRAAAQQRRPNER